MMQSPEEILAAQDADRARIEQARRACIRRLASNSDFATACLDGWMKELEDYALAQIATCDAADLIEHRAGWIFMCNLRRNIRKDLDAARLTTEP